uniref:Uncharacterized protein n=1 Tax=viral metagenome TaxID=1070528 RepID=A0A6M3L316_9ZZZZ
MKKKTDDIPINEMYPVDEPRKDYQVKGKMVVHVKVRPLVWQGQEFKTADVNIDHCCQESIDRAEEFFPQRSDAPNCGRNPENFLKMMYEGKPMDTCPFCGAPVETKED